MNKAVKYGAITIAVLILLALLYGLWSFVNRPLSDQPQPVNNSILNDIRQPTQINCVRLCDDWTPGIGQVAHIKSVPHRTAKYTVYEPYEKLMKQLQQQVDNKPQPTTFTTEELSSPDLVINNIQPWSSQQSDYQPTRSSYYNDHDWYAPVLYGGGYRRDSVVIENITNNINTNCDACCVDTNQPPSMVPEPPAISLLVIGLLGIILMRRRK